MAKMSVKGIVHTSAFGPRKHSLDPAEFHFGADYGPPKRNQTVVPLFAIIAGPVRRMKDSHGALGIRVGARDTEAIEFWHLASYTKGLGKVVTDGEEVGEMGTTGLSTGIHVHVEHWVGGKRIDPVPFVNRQANKPVAARKGDTDMEEGFLVALTPKQQERALALLEAIRSDQLFGDGEVKFSRAQRTQDRVQEIRDALLEPVDGFPPIDVLRTHAIATLRVLTEQAKSQGVELDEESIVDGVLEGLGKALVERG